MSSKGLKNLTAFEFDLPAVTARRHRAGFDVWLGTPRWNHRPGHWYEHVRRFGTLEGVTKNSASSRHTATTTKELIGGK
jgi:hypothetical protein